MTPDNEFYLKMLGVFVAAGLLFKYMMYLQRKKEAEAEAKFQFTLRMIELRNKKYEGPNESEKKN